MTQNEAMGWVIGALVVVVGLFKAVGKPMIDLNTTLTKFDLTLARLSKDFDDHIVISKKEFDEVWDCEERQDNDIRENKTLIQEHESRLTKIETKRTRKKATE